MSGIKSNTWYLVGVGALGMIQDTVLAGLARRPENYGFNLAYRNGVADAKVMSALIVADIILGRHLGKPHTLASLYGIFFPGRLWETEEQ